MRISYGKAAWIGLVLVAVVGAAALGGAWYARHRRQAGVCAICRRPVHGMSRTVAEVDGEREEACCPACVLALKAQTRKRVRLLAVTDYVSGQPIEPEDAVYVVGSDVETCTQHAGTHEPHLNQEERRMDVHFDRCEPSILAFRNRGDAERFAKDHGGKVGTLRDLGINPDDAGQPAPAGKEGVR